MVKRRRLDSRRGNSHNNASNNVFTPLAKAATFSFIALILLVVFLRISPDLERFSPDKIETSDVLIDLKEEEQGVFSDEVQPTKPKITDVDIAALEKTPITPISDYEKIKEDEEFDVIIDKSGEDENGNLIVLFHHNSKSAQPIAIIGDVEYKLSKETAAADEVVSLVIYNWDNDYFRIAVGSSTEVLEFGKQDKKTIKTAVKNAGGETIVTDIEITDSLTEEVVYQKKDDSHSAKLGEGRYDIKIKPENHLIKSIDFEDVDVEEDISKLVNIDDVEDNLEFKELYAIDPVGLTFKQAVVTVTAKGTELKKCKDWDFENQLCKGDWVFVKTIIPGQEYTFILTPDDPGFAEGISTCAAENNAAKGTFADSCDGTYPSSCGSSGDLLKCNDGFYETQTYYALGSTYQYAGLQIQNYNTSVTNCEDITKVQVCYEGWVNGNPSDCDLSVDADGGASYSLVKAVCPGTTANPGVACADVTALESWTCSNFFGASGTRAKAKVELTTNSNKYSGVLTTDVFFFNVTYAAPLLPVVNIIWPEEGTEHGDGFMAVGYRVTNGTGSITSCSLINNANQQILFTSPDVPKDTLQRFTREINAEGTYTIYINCTDSAGAVGKSSLRTFNVIASKADVYGEVRNSTGSSINSTLEVIQNDAAVYNQSGFRHAFTVNDGFYDVILTSPEYELKSMKFYDVNISRNLVKLIDIEDINITNAGIVRMFSIDPSSFIFDNATITTTAVGNRLFKCPGWNFTNQSCSGNWIDYRFLVPGENYELTITSTDPGFMEINATDAIHLDENYGFVSNIFDEIYEDDGTWSEAIPEDHFVRVTYQANLSNESVIDVRARSINSSNTWFEVYLPETTEPLLGTSLTFPAEGTFAYVTVANMTEPADTFDFKIINNEPGTTAALEFDYIHDKPVSKRLSSYWWLTAADATIGGEHTAYGSGFVGTPLHLRIQGTADNNNWLGDQLSLYYSTTDAWGGEQVLVTTTSANIRYWDDTDHAAGTVITDSGSLVCTGTDVAEHYVEADPSAAMLQMSTNNQGEWDFAVNFTAAGTYYLRMYESDGTALDAYDYSAEVTVAAPADTTPPTWNETPNNLTREAGSDFYYKVNASDDNTGGSGITTYEINDTINFQIDSSSYGGEIRNNSLVPPGLYWVNVSAIDGAATPNMISTEFNITFVDTTPPVWNETPDNITRNVLVGVDYTVNASDHFLSNYEINDTINFKIDSNTGLIQNNSHIQPNSYWINVSAIDTSGNMISTEMNITCKDMTPPTWNETPKNLTREAGSDFYYKINASDDDTGGSLIVTYEINDTINFKITSSSYGGEIQNNSLVPPNSYWINASAIDGSGNMISTEFNVTFKDTTIPTWNETPRNKSFEAGTEFDYDVNASDHFLDNYFINDTTYFKIDADTGYIENNTLLAPRTYWLNISANDTSANILSVVINITVVDTTIPTWNETPRNKTLEAGTEFDYDVNASDLFLDSYQINDTTYFKIDADTGYIENNTLLLLRTYWLNITVNDTSDNQHPIVINITVVDTTPPTWNETPKNISLNCTEPAVDYDINASDSYALDGYYIDDTENFTIDVDTGLLQNNSYLDIGTYWVNITVNDTAGNYIAIVINVTKRDVTAPFWNETPKNQTYEYPAEINYDVNATDNCSIDDYFISDTENFTIDADIGLLQNNSLITLGTYWINVSVNDTAGNTRITLINITVVDTTIPTWNETPDNHTLEAGIEFDYDVNASDYFLDDYFINDTTYFKIDADTGYIENNTLLLPRTYWLNISANDTSANILSVVINITVIDTTIPTWNETPRNKTLEAGTEFDYDVNASDLFLDSYQINDTTNFKIDADTGYIENNTFLQLGTFWLNISANDTSNNLLSNVINITVVDTTIPTWNETPRNKTVSPGAPFYYDVNASDLFLDAYQINDTTNFKIDADTGVIENNTDLDVRTYWLNISANDTSGNLLSVVINITVIDEMPPTWNETPRNKTLEAGTEFDYDVNATDYFLDDYFINDTTYFKIDADTGYIENNTFLQLGTYWLNISANDTSANILSVVINITVVDTTTPTWNETPDNKTLEAGYEFDYNVNASDLFLDSYQINDTTNFKIDADTGYIENNTLLLPSTYWLNISVNDTSNNLLSNVINITVVDTTIPTWNETPRNKTLEAGTEFDYDVNATDYFLDAYQINDTTYFKINADTGYIENNTLLLPSTYWLNISANDTSGNMLSIVINITVVDTTIPTWNETPKNKTLEAGTEFDYDVNASDLFLDSYQINDTTNFKIDADTGYIENNTFLQLGTFWLNISANDTSNNLLSNVINITVVDTTIPTWNETPKNKTLELGSSFYYDVNASDLFLDAYQINDTTNFKIDANTGVIENNTDLAIGTYWLNISANDTSANILSTVINITVVLTAVPPNWSDLNEIPADPLYYVPDRLYQFNISWIDDDGMNNVWIEWDGVNYTEEVLNVSSVYMFNRTNLTAGVHNYTWYGNDTNGDINFTNQNYTILAIKEYRLNGTLVNGSDEFLNASFLVYNSTGDIVYASNETYNFTFSGTEKYTMEILARWEDEVNHIWIEGLFNNTNTTDIIHAGRSNHTVPHFIFDTTTLKYDTLRIEKKPNTTRNIQTKCMGTYNLETFTCEAGWWPWYSWKTAGYANYTYAMGDPVLSELDGMFFEDFESGGFTKNNWTVEGSDVLWIVSTGNTPPAGEYHAVGKNTGAETNMTVNISTASYAYINLSYIRSAQGFSAGDYLKVYWHDGTTWTLLETVTTADVITKNWSLPGEAFNNPDFKVQFRCLNNRGVEWCSVDNVYVTGILNDTAPVINWINATPKPAIFTQLLNISANVTDDVGIDKVWCEFNFTNRTMRLDLTDVYSNDTINISTIHAGVYNFTVYVNDTYGHTSNMTANFTIQAVMLIEILNGTINFTSGEVGNTLNALSEHGFPLYVLNRGNVNLSLNVSGTNLTGLLNDHVIRVDYVEWDNVSSFDVARPLNYSQDIVQQIINLGKNSSVYFRITIPLGIMSQNYTGNVTFTAES